MELDTLFDQWASSKKSGSYNEVEKHITSARRYTSSAGNVSWQWLSESLQDKERKWFVAKVFEKLPVPKKLQAKMLLAGILEKNPSSNRYFIEPCVRSFGSRHILSELLKYLQSGTDEQKSGAASAYYWVPRNANAESDDDLRNQIRCQMLSEFVQNNNLEVRRRIIPMLILDPNMYPESFRAFIAEAIRIARSHVDEYIRHRIEVQLGAGGPFKSIPN